MERHEQVVQGSLDLAHGNLVRIEDARGTRVRVASGAIWVTEEGDRRDRFINAGGSFRIATSGVALISALTPHSTISVSLPLPASRLARLRARVVDAWRGMSVPGARPSIHQGVIPCN